MVVVRLEMASEMGWPRVSFVAVLDDAGVVSWGGNLMSTSVTALRTRAFRTGGSAVFEL